jgi:hypothetical protein
VTTPEEHRHGSLGWLQVTPSDVFQLLAVVSDPLVLLFWLERGGKLLGILRDEMIELLQAARFQSWPILVDDLVEFSKVLRRDPKRWRNLVSSRCD